MSASLDGPAQAFHTFEEEDCDEVEDWHEWASCEDERNKCRELPYSVKSFRVSCQNQENHTFLLATVLGVSLESHILDVHRMAVFTVAAAGILSLL